MRTTLRPTTLSLNINLYHLTQFNTKFTILSSLRKYNTDESIDATNTKLYNVKKRGLTNHKWRQGRVFMPKQWLTVEEIAEELGVHPETVRIWIRERELPAVKLRRTYRVKREDYEEFLRRRYTGKQADKQE